MAAHHFISGEQHPFPRLETHYAGMKRHAEDDLERQSTISTQFKKLRINNAGRPIPPQTGLQTALPQHVWYGPGNYIQQHNSSSHLPPVAVPTSIQPLCAVDAPALPQPPTQIHGPPSMTKEDFMPLDSTPHRLFIPDLDAEIAAIEAAEESSRQASDPSSYYIPDHIDKHLSRIPDHVLRTNMNPGPSNQLVLYRDPSSISVPENEDAVRKAIVEARRRARERQAKEREESGKQPLNNFTNQNTIPSPSGHAPVPARPEPVTSLWQRRQRSPPLVPSPTRMMESGTPDQPPNHNSAVEDESSNDSDPDAMDLG